MATPDSKTIGKLLIEFKQKYPQKVQTQAFAGQDRDIEHVKLLFRPNGVLLDLGGGTNSANLVLAHLGMRVTVVDIFEEYWTAHFTTDEIAQIRKLFASENVCLVDADILTFDYRKAFAGTQFDIISSFNCFEHLHHSPKPMLENCLSLLKPGGQVFFGVPNSVNIYKRIKVLFGKTNHPSFEKFYYHGSPWYGHIREYSRGDWEQLARFLQIKETRIFGYNWNLYTSKRFPKALAGPVDRMLRLIPSFCTDVCLVGSR